jgi:hypothetical protein
LSTWEKEKPKASAKASLNFDTNKEISKFEKEIDNELKL